MLLSSDKWQAVRDRQWAIHEASAYVLLPRIEWPRVLLARCPPLAGYCQASPAPPPTPPPSLPPRWVRMHGSNDLGTACQAEGEWSKGLPYWLTVPSDGWACEGNKANRVCLSHCGCKRMKYTGKNDEKDKCCIHVQTAVTELLTTSWLGPHILTLTQISVR